MRSMGAWELFKLGFSQLRIPARWRICSLGCPEECRAKPHVTAPPVAIKVSITASSTSSRPGTFMNLLLLSKLVSHFYQTQKIGDDRNTALVEDALSKPFAENKRKQSPCKNQSSILVRLYMVIIDHQVGILSLFPFLLLAVALKGETVFRVIGVWRKK